MPHKDKVIAEDILRVCKKAPSMGSKKLSVILKRKGKVVNHKRIDRVREQLGLIKKKKKSKKIIVTPQKLPLIERRNDVWSIDFVHERLADYRPYRILTVIDLCTRESPDILVGASLQAKKLICFFNRLKEVHGLPKRIILDNGPEFRSKKFNSWAKENFVNLHFIEKGSPTQNAYIESFNGKLRYEFLNHYKFENVPQASQSLKKWLKHYNEVRPHGSLDYLTPKEYLSKIG